MKIKKIKWRDSRMYIEQVHPDSDFEVCIMESIGYVIEEDKKKIVLAGDMVDEGYFRRVIVIPKENIVDEKLI